MNPVVAPWIAETILITWRSVRSKQRPPLPSELLAGFVVFGTVSLLSNSQPKLAATFAWGVVVATMLNFIDPSTGKPKVNSTVPTDQPGAVKYGIN